MTPKNAVSQLGLACRSQYSTVAVMIAMYAFMYVPTISDLSSDRKVTPSYFANYAVTHGTVISHCNTLSGHITLTWVQESNLCSQHVLSPAIG